LAAAAPAAGVGKNRSPLMTDKIGSGKAHRTSSIRSALWWKKTEANGCTEAEALAAAEHAQSLMAKYGFNSSELETISSRSTPLRTDGTPNRR